MHIVVLKGADICYLAGDDPKKYCEKFKVTTMVFKLKHCLSHPETNCNLITLISEGGNAVISE